MRKGSGVPYIIHPLGVMELLIKHNCSQEAIIAGILHDVVEDTPYTLDDISHHFGEKVAKLVNFASEYDKTLSWKERKIETIDRVQLSSDVDALHVSCCDKLHNVLSMQNDLNEQGDSFWNNFNATKSQQKWYHSQLAKAFIQKPFIKEKITTKYYQTVQNLFQKTR